MDSTGLIVVSVLGLAFAILVYLGHRYKNALHDWAEKHLR